MLGVNLSGAEFGSLSGVYGKAYIYPSLKDLETYAGKGVELVRLPFKWERMQATLDGPLDPAELGRMKAFLADADKAGVKVIIDAHNYGRYRGEVIGGGTVTSAQFADFWGKLAGALKGQAALVGYDLMNEPHDMGGATRWPAAAQAAVDAIRKVDMKHDIYVEGDGWSSAATWGRINRDLHIDDPAGKIIYEAHEYFDHNNSGTYAGSYDDEKATPQTGVDRLKPFADWLEATGSKGFIGEFSVPKDDPRWLTVLDNFLDALDAHNIGGTYWGAGPWWGKYPEALMTGNVANPQLAVLLDHLDDAGQQDGASPTTPVPPTESDERFGTAGDDTLDGGAGVDVLHGLAGNDHLVGKGGDDVLFGDAGNDKIEGGTGDDLMIGGTGNDHYFIDAAGDSVTELAGGGTDTVDTSISYMLAANVENLTLRSGAAINGTGNALDNVLVGNSAANILNGGAGDDVLRGGGGADTLTGGGGEDSFVFRSVKDSRGGAIDTITDFTSGQDHVDLSRMDANAKASGDQAFDFIGSAAFGHKAGTLRATVTDGHTVVQGDVNGDGAADFTLYLSGSHHLSAGDFIL